jgi:hypothetical protein
MKNLLVAVSIAGMSLSSFGSPLMKSESCTVKYDKKKNKKSKKKVKHIRCEAYNG